MAIQVFEHVTSRAETVGGIDSSNAGRAELVYRVLEGWSALAVRAAVLAVAPLEYHFLLRGPISMTPLGAGIWEVVVPYAKIQNKISVQFDAMCEKVKKLHSLRTIANVKVRYTGNALTAPPDFNRLVGVSKDKVEGVDVWDPAEIKFTLQWEAKWANISAAYVDTVRLMRARTNEQAVIFNHKGQQYFFEIGSLLCLGGTFHDTNDDGASITLKFEGRPSESNISIGDLNGETVTTLTGTLTSGNLEVTGLSSTADLRSGMKITGLLPGSGVPDDTYIALVDSATQITMNNVAEASGATSLVFSNPYLPTKEGQHYVWVRTVKVRGPNNVEVEVPDSAHIEQMYNYGDFSLLQVFDVINSYTDVINAELNVRQQEEEAEVGQIPALSDFGGLVPAP